MFRRQLRVTVLIVAAFFAGELALFVLDWVMERLAKPIEDSAAAMVYQSEEHPSSGAVAQTRTAS